MLNPSLEGVKCVECLEPFEPDQLLETLVGDNMQVAYAHAHCVNQRCKH